MLRHFRAARASAGLLAAVALGASFAAAAGALPYRVLHRISLSGAGPVQAVAFGPDGKHLYAAVGDQLRSYDTGSGQPGQTIRLPGVGVGLAADGGDLYVVTRAPARLVMLTLQPLRITSSVAVRGAEPSALLYDSDADALYVESRAGDSVARLDPKSGKTLGVAHLHGRLEQMAANGRGTLYVANTADNELEAIETDKMTRSGAIPLSGCSAPTGLAIDTVGRRLFVACGNGQALVVDEDMGFPFVRLPIEQAAGLQTVFALHPFGSDGWKGGAFIAGDGPAVDAIQMKAFISYVGGGSLPLGGRCTALAVSPAARQLVLALAPRATGAGSAGAGPAADGSRSEASGVELWVLGGGNRGVSP
jgi:DNA-binding beta-propeller fold protein YncE